MWLKSEIWISSKFLSTTKTNIKLFFLKNYNFLFLQNKGQIYKQVLLMNSKVRCFMNNNTMALPENKNQQRHQEIMTTLLAFHFFLPERKKVNKKLKNLADNILRYLMWRHNFFSNFLKKGITVTFNSSIPKRNDYFW